MQNSAFWTRVTSLYGSQTWPVNLRMYNSGLNIRISSLYGTHPSSVVFACKTAWLASEPLVSMGPCPQVWFLDAKQRLMDRNNKSLLVPDITYRLVLLNSAICTRMTSLNGSQPLPVVFASKTATFWPDLQVCMGPRSHLWFWAHITASLAQE